MCESVTWIHSLHDFLSSSILQDCK